MTRLPSRFAPLLFSAFQAALTTAIATAIATLQTTALGLAFVFKWLFAWGVAWITILPLVMFAAPFIQRTVRHLTINSDETNDC